MKIQTQAWFLVAGIVLAPLLILLFQTVYRLFLTNEYESGLTLTDQEVSVLMDESADNQEPGSFFRPFFRSRSQSMTIFRDDFYVIYSTLPEFVSGSFVKPESILLLQDENQADNFVLSSRTMANNKVYILTMTTDNRLREDSRPREDGRPPENRVNVPPPVFFPALIGNIIIGILLVFAVCMSIIIIRSITRSVQVLENATRRIAEGELDITVDAKGSNEITSLTNSLNKMRNSLKEEELRRSRFIMGITHDLKTPLALIKGYAEAIEDGITADPVSRLDATEIIIAKADQLEGMINDLINYVRMDTGEWRAQLGNISLSAFLKKTVNQLSQDIELLHHEFVSDITLPEDTAVLMDERLVLRALENLIHNAARYTPQGSTIRLGASLAENSVSLTICDNGPGIDAGDLPHIFEMFYRGTSSRREQGMGLGLAVVKWVVDYHGWTISASAEKDKGTCFIINIPLPA